jgi:hypothetical protein
MTLQKNRKTSGMFLKQNRLSFYSIAAIARATLDIAEKELPGKSRESRQ